MVGTCARRRRALLITAPGHDQARANVEPEANTNCNPTLLHMDFSLAHAAEISPLWACRFAGMFAEWVAEKLMPSRASPGTPLGRASAVRDQDDSLLHGNLTGLPSPSFSFKEAHHRASAQHTGAEHLGRPHHRSPTFYRAAGHTAVSLTPRLTGCRARSNTANPRRWTDSMLRFAVSAWRTANIAA